MDYCNDLIVYQREVYLSLMSEKSMEVKVSFYLISYWVMSDHLIYIFTKKMSWHR